MLYEKYGCSLSPSDFVEDGANVWFFTFLLDDLVVLVVVSISELHQLKHDRLLRILELLVDFLRVCDLGSIYSD